MEDLWINVYLYTCFLAESGNVVIIRNDSAIKQVIKEPKMFWILAKYWAPVTCSM